MTQTLSNLARQALTALLVVCVSFCCCQANALVVLSDVAAGASVDACATGCCERPEAPDDDGDTPTRRCQSCCVKGTGPQDTSVTLPDVTVVAAPALPAPLPIAAPPSVARPRPLEVTPCVPPPTLLRLHCALVV